MEHLHKVTVTVVTETNKGTFRAVLVLGENDEEEGCFAFGARVRETIIAIPEDIHG